MFIIVFPTLHPFVSGVLMINCSSNSGTFWNSGNNKVRESSKVLHPRLWRGPCYRDLLQKMPPAVGSVEVLWCGSRIDFSLLDDMKFCRTPPENHGFRFQFSLKPFDLFWHSLGSLILNDSDRFYWLLSEIVKENVASSMADMISPFLRCSQWFFYVFLQTSSWMAG